MAPYINAHESAIDDTVDTSHVKSKIGVSQIKLEATAKPPVADDYMYDFKYNHALPTSDVLQIEIPDDCDAQKEARSIVSRLSEVLGKGDAQGFADLFLEYGEFSCLSISPKMVATADQPTSLRRCLARQALLHLGLPNLQFHTSNFKGRYRHTP